MLEFGANPMSTTLVLLYESRYDTRDIDSDEIYESMKILIDAGARFGIVDIHHQRMTRWSSLIIQSMAGRRKKLWEWACCFLPSSEIARFKKDENTIIDARVKELHEALEGLRKPAPPSLKESRGWVPSQSVYHHDFVSQGDSIVIFDELYAAGFRDIDDVDDSGETPSMARIDIKKVAWLASKGADCNRRLPQFNGTAALLWSINIIYSLDDRFPYSGRPSLGGLQRWKKRTTEYRHDILVLCMLHASPDVCVCPCSPDGCTILSVALRYLFSRTLKDRIRPIRSHLREDYPNLARYFEEPESPGIPERRYLQHILGALITIFEAMPKAERIIIRAMTFEGLGIKHACCTEVDSWFLYRVETKEARGKSDDEVNEILDEERNRYMELEKLVLEFDTKFTELGLPIWEFLTKHWRPRMIDYLSHRDPYDEEHRRETRKLGIDLEVDDSDIPCWIHFLGDQVEELDDGES